MLKKTITFKDLDGNEVTEDFYFNISKAEVTKRAMLMDSDYAERLSSLSIETDGKLILDTFDDILSSAVGKRHENNKQFVKSPEISSYFMQSGAYETFFMELISMPDSGAAFINGLLPPKAELDKIAADVKKAAKERGDISVELPQSGVIEGVAADAAVQAEKPQPDTFPTNLERAVEHNQPSMTYTEGIQKLAGAEQGADDDPAWMREGRYATKKELMSMSPEDLAFAMKMKASKAFG